MGIIVGAEQFVEFGVNVMYDVPSRKDVGRVVITDEVVRDNVLPTLLPREVTPAPTRRSRQEKTA